ncbi:MULTISPECIES: hypothetical protein [Paenarthrobacter]|jgi:hypothetical protein|uniref:Integral membrane protein n=1 Tax=Paenarthrobacter ureafaciens TaxID=37931 RepID=A0AAX3EPX7_PAEUR|nr:MULTISPECIES: hypothetical protein [Paenarthrobacter]NKR09888.1 hypothetical protein [Arthrobacter sp. M5]NKR16703.1 hypothetical protein [Arthrobacter sp. M6]MCW3767302.1 hypothetical protein [Paenarthrobacter sp. PAE-2]MDO5866979.1 hypothetical protein [Paenarthrobacter sp. SD-2]MDO5878080.1 hypothetical protein [Paenarthrobacter sp. SD-1]
MDERRARLVRGWAAAAAATSIAAFSHVFAGGFSPDPALLALSLAVSGLVCTALAGRVLSLWRLSAGVLLSQALFHGLFSLNPASQAEVPRSGHAGHADHLPMMDPGAVAAMDHTSPLMWAAHAVAALATIAVLRHGEVTAVRLAMALRLRLIPFLIVCRPLALAPQAALDPSSWPVRARRNLGVPLLVMRHRGPPLRPNMTRARRALITL